MIPFLVEQGAELALGLTVVLAAGALAVRVSRAPLHRHRLAELTLFASVCAAVLLATPMPRPAAGWWATPPTAAPARRPSAAPLVVAWEPRLLSPGSIAREARSSAPAPVAPAIPTRPTHPVAVLFLVGAAVMAGHLALALVLLRRTLRRAGRAPAWIASLAAEIAGSSPPRVLVSAREVRPFCCGLGRGTVVLPRCLAQPALATRVEAVLRHEHAHLVQRHPRGRLLAALAAPLLYWHPLYWWLVREQRSSAELLADDMAVGEFDRRRYVEELLELAESARRVRTPQVSRLGVLGSRQDFLRRMETLLMRPNRLATRSSARHVTTRSLCACLLLAGVSVAWGMPPQDDTVDPPQHREAASVSRFLDATFRGFAPAATPQHERLRATFAVTDATALGQLMLRCADGSLEIGAVDVLAPEAAGHRTCTLQLSGASVEALAALVASLEGVELLSVQAPAPAEKAAAAPPSTHVNQQLARLAQQVDQLTQQYADMQAVHSHILTAFGASPPRRMDLLAIDTEELEGAVAKLIDPVRTGPITGPITGTVMAVHENCEHVRLYGKDECLRLVSFNRGSLQGLTKGQSLEIYSGASYKGRARIIHVLEESSFGVISLEVEGQHIEAGDSATTDL